jgi:asparagine synthase (glutamine-hydrolysing)
MCGITGFVNLDGAPASFEKIRKMTDALFHRGPDGDGRWIEGNCAIGHRRLSIRDLSDAAAQPMISPNGRYVLTYNGEIYNHQELKKELVRLGHTFTSTTDTEVILYALVQWGPKALGSFNGMFALALWDRLEKTLLLARDRYGTKPLYYSTQSRVFYFGSEQKAITAASDFHRSLNKEALLEYFTFQNILTDQTLLENVNLLPHGCYATIKPSNPKPSITRYWDYKFESPVGRDSETEYEEELRRLMGQAVERQLVSDVEVGAYLSGGVDSGSIVSFASKTLSNLKTFTVGFDLSSANSMEVGFDERKKARLAASFYGTNHHERVLTSGEMQTCLPDLVFHLEEPRVGQSYPNFYAAKLASESVKVVLSGTGGDEMFGGYPWRYFVPRENSSLESYIDAYYLYWQRLLSNTELRRVFDPIWGDVKHVWTRDIFRDVLSNHQVAPTEDEHFINQSMYFESKTFLQGLLIVEDKLSMSQGLESRVPFLDNDLVDFAMSCPVSLKVQLEQRDPISVDENDLVKKSIAADSTGKQILRKALAVNIPQTLNGKPKQGFSGPDASWYRGDSYNYILNEILVADSPISGLFDSKYLSELVEEHTSGKQNRRLLIWSLLSVNEYLRQNF